MAEPVTTRSVAEIDKLITEWQALRADYERRGSTGIVDFINGEIRKLLTERDSAAMPMPTPRPEA